VLPPAKCPFERVRSEIGLERLQAAATLEAGQLPPIDVHQLDQVRGSYNHLRPAIHAVLDALALHGASPADDELLAALTRVRASRGRFVDEPLVLVPKAWRAHINSLGRYELNRQPPPAGQLRPLRQSNADDQVVPSPPLGVSDDKH